MPDKKITPDTIVVRNDGQYITSTVGDEIVMMDMEKGNYIGINSVGSAIWEMIAEPKKVSEISGRLMELYDVEKEQCESQTLAYLEKINELGMLKVFK